MASSYMTRFHVFLPADTLAKLRKEADKRGISVSELMRQAAQEFIRKSRR